MVVSKRLSELMKDSSWIRAMFEEGLKLKERYGEENVFDFTLGNPVTEPPYELKREIVRIVSSGMKGLHRYMPNNGYEDVRREIAELYRESTGLPFTEDHIVMTVGAAGGMNVILKSILDPYDEVIVPSPFFIEFKFYIDNHGGVMRLVDTKEDFHLDLEAIEKAINEKTKAIIINSPHNPTGVVYNKNELIGLANILRERREREGQRIFIISDEAYRKLIYDNIEFPDLFRIYEDTVVVMSHSKDLSLAGERIGYIAISPLIEGAQALIGAAVFANRTLGFINAPALMQRVVKKFQKNSVDINEYQKRRDAIYTILLEAGIETIKPNGAFYIFPKSPIPDDVEFVRHLQKHHILAVPGSGFGKSGHFRLAYCVDLEMIERSRPYFIRAMEALRR
jgi:aspartate aminotransferase